MSTSAACCNVIDFIDLSIIAKSEMFYIVVNGLLVLGYLCYKKAYTVSNAEVSARQQCMYEGP